MSFNNFDPGFNPTTGIASLPNDYNKTDSEIVEMGGHRYIKKTTTLKKGGPGSTFFVRSTTFERVDDNENADRVPTEEEAEAGKKDPVRPDASQPEAEAAAPDAASSSPAPAPAPETPKKEDGSESKPDVVPSSSEAPAATSDGSSSSSASPSSVSGIEREDVADAPATEQPTA